jgi:TolB-like protein/Tfp pilus assembly protein PilF
MNDFTSSSADLVLGFNLGPWRVEPRRNTIFQGDEVRHLENRLMQTLVFLAEHQGQVISREQFFDSVWQGRVVNEEALSRAISLLRTALGDNAYSPEFIQTVPGAGYCLIAPVAGNGSARAKLPTLAGAQDNSIAVLPFVNLSDDPGNEYFSEGISEEILNVLAQVRRFKVVGRTSSFAFKDRNEDLREIGRALSVSHVLEGSVRKSGMRVRVTAQLINTIDGYHLWSETFDRNLEDIFAVQDEIANAVSSQLKQTLLPTTAKVTETDPEAYTLYLQARYLERQSTARAYKRALNLIREALEIAPDYVAARTGLASIYRNMTAKAVMAPSEGLRLAREAAMQALEYNPDYAPAHGLLGWLACHFDPDLSVAAGHFQRALILAPTDIDIISGAAHLARSLGRLDTAIALLSFANARDPINPASLTHLGFFYRCAGRYKEAVSSYHAALRLSPEIIGAHYNIGMARLHQGRFDDALTETLLEEEEVYRLMGLVPIFHSMGRAAESDAAMAKMIANHEDTASYNIGFMHAYRGENDLAFDWLETALSYHDAGLSQINTEPIIEKLHSDPRWVPFMEKIGMSDEQLAAIEFEVTLPD